MRRAIGVYCRYEGDYVSLLHCKLYKACPNDNEPIGCEYASDVIYVEEDDESRVSK